MNFAENLELTADQLASMLTEETILKISMIKEKEKILANYNWPEKPNTRGYYVMNLPCSYTTSGRTQISGKTIDELKDKVYQYLRNTPTQSPRTALKHFKDIFDLVCENKLAYAKGEKRLSVENTVKRDKSEYKRFFGDTDFENMPITRITKKDIEAIIFDNLEKYDLKKKGFQSLTAILRSVFKYAFQEDIIIGNTFEKVNLAKFSGMIKDDTDIALRVHTDDELDRMLDYIHNHQLKHPKYIGSYALEMQILCGLRRGEVPPIRWSDINNGYIRLSKEQITLKNSNGIKEQHIIVNHTKNRQNRDFIIFNELEDFLTRLKDVHDAYYPDSDFLFPADTDEGCITNNVVYNFYRRMCANLGITLCNEFKKGPHSYRRNAYTSFLINSNGDYRTAQKLFGTTCIKNYDTGAVNKDNMKDIMNKRFA